MTAPLAGTGVLVTRPSAQAEPLCRLIEAAGGTAVRFPVLAIEPLAESPSLRRQLDLLPQCDLAVFISANAVEHGLSAIRRHGGWPAGLATVAIGQATAAALAGQGHIPAITPNGRGDSETLLEHPSLQRVADRRIAIFRGVGGRERLAETLRARGAEVAYVETYRRIMPAIDPQPLLAAWRTGGVDVAVVTSVEGMDNLWAMVGDEGRRRLRATPLVVASARVLKRALDLGVAIPPRVAAETGDEGLYGALVAWRQRRPNA